jgi:TRAP-type C4-dicarboxylate transport system permease small subunit
MPPARRVVFVIVGKILVIGFLALLGWIGFSVLDVLATDYLISLPDVSVAWTQSVIPISCALFILAELLNFPDTIQAARGLADVEASDLAERLH